VKLSNVLSPLDTCHGDSKEHSSITPQGENKQGTSGGPLNLSGFATLFLIVVSVAFFAISFIDGPYWPKIDDTFSANK